MLREKIQRGELQPGDRLPSTCSRPRPTPGTAPPSPAPRVVCCPDENWYRISHTGLHGPVTGCVGDLFVNEVRDWLNSVRATNSTTFNLIDDAIYTLSRSGPALKRPLVGTIAGYAIKNLKELRPRLDRA